MDKQIISNYMKKQNNIFHKEREDWGKKGKKWSKGIKYIVKKYNYESVVDYGAGKCMLGKNLSDFVEVQSYEPAFESTDIKPTPSDFVVCTHVLEHVEPEFLENVLDNLKYLAKKGLLISVDSGPSGKLLPDGRDSNLIQEDISWWFNKLKEYFPEFHIINIDRRKFNQQNTIKEINSNKKGTFFGEKIQP